MGRFRTFTPVGQFAAYETTFWGVAPDVAFRIGPRFRIQGEFYAGRALGPYLGTINQRNSKGRNRCSR